MRLFAHLLCALLLAPHLAAACGVSASLQPSRLQPRLIRASTAAEDDGVRISFIGHASFEIETPSHLRAVTDYNGVNIPAAIPDVVTMNHAHSTHFTDDPDPRIRTVLHGWRDDGGPARISFSERDLRIHNLPTNIRDWGGGTEPYGNSIFVFETAGLCIAHLGHLHHLLTPDDLAALGELDVVMAPVDGGYTLSDADMLTVLDVLHPRLVLPMHAFNRSVLQRFLDLARDRYTIRLNPTPSVTLTRAILPASPEILVLPGRFL